MEEQFSIDRNQNGQLYLMHQVFIGGAMKILLMFSRRIMILKVLKEKSKYAGVVEHWRKRGILDATV